MSQSAVGGPQFEGAIERGRCYILRIGGDIHGDDLIVVTLQRLQRLPRLVGPDLCSRVIGAGD